MLSVSTAAYDGHPLDVALAELARIGVDRVEPAYIRGYVDFDESAFSDAAAARFASRLAAHGLTAQAVSAHMTLSGPDASAALARRIAFAAGIGAPVLITNAGPAAEQGAILATIAANIGRLEDAGIRLALENPGHGSGDIFGHAAEGLALLDAIGAPQVGLNYDIGNVWTYNNGRVPLAGDLTCALPHMVHAHLKDIRSDGGDWVFCPLGQGGVGYGAIAAQLARAAPALPLALELPLRLRRPNRGDPERVSDPLPLPAIADAITGSLAFWRAASRNEDI